MQLLRKCLFNTQTIGEFRSDPCMRSHLTENTELLTLCYRSAAMKDLKEEAETAESPIVVRHMPKTCVNVWSRDGASSVHADAFLVMFNLERRCHEELTAVVRNKSGSQPGKAYLQS